MSPKCSQTPSLSLAQIDGKSMKMSWVRQYGGNAAVSCGTGKSTNF